MKRIWLSAVAIAALASGTALAQTQGDQTTTVMVSEGEGPSATPKRPGTLMLQGGVEGYSGNLASRINPGETYGLSLGFDPVRALGGEIGYTGAVNELRSRTTGGIEAASGPDLMRNGGYVVLKPGWTFPLDPAESAAIRPYVLGGFGLDWYDVRGLTGRFGFSDQMIENVPMGAGIQARAGAFTVDARFNYAYLFGDQWAAADANPWRYQGQLRLGAAF